MSIKKTNLRFNLSNEKDKKAWEELQNIDKKKYKSMNKFIISLINNYSENKCTEKNESDIIEKIISAIREELKNSLYSQLMNISTQSQNTTFTNENTAENENAVMDFIDNL